MTETSAVYYDPYDAAIDAEPGKIVHEVRHGRGALAWFPLGRERRLRCLRSGLLLGLRAAERDSREGDVTDPVPLFREIADTHDRCFWLDGGGARPWSGRRSILGWLEDDDVSLLLKRSFDVVVAGTALVLLSPVLGAIALAVRLDSPGPIATRPER